MIRKMEPERVIKSERVYEGTIICVRRDDVVVSKLDRGIPAFREVVEHSDAVVIVPMDKDGNILLVRQFRHAIGETLLEAPAGGVEKQEAPIEAAQRELREETGYRADRLIPLGNFWVAPGWTDEHMYAFMASGLAPDRADMDEDENIQVVPIPWQNVLELIQCGEIRDAKTIAALLIAFGMQPTKISGNKVI